MSDHDYLNSPEFELINEMRRHESVYHGSMTVIDCPVCLFVNQLEKQFNEAGMLRERFNAAKIRERNASESIA